MKIPHILSLGLTLAFLWIVLSAHYSWLLLMFGLFSVIFVVHLANRMDVVDQEGHPFQLNLLSLFNYWGWLLKEIFFANLDVCRRILDPKLPISPVIIKVPCSQSDDLGRVIYANSITLTPGTVSLEVDESGIKVHALTSEAATVLRRGEMDRRVTEFSG